MIGLSGNTCTASTVAAGAKLFPVYGPARVQRQYKGSLSPPWGDSATVSAPLVKSAKQTSKPVPPFIGNNKQMSHSYVNTCYSFYVRLSFFLLLHHYILDLVTCFKYFWTMVQLFSQSPLQWMWSSDQKHHNNTFFFTWFRCGLVQDQTWLDQLLLIKLHIDPL